MHHFLEALTNPAGDSQVGFFARVIDPDTQATIPLYADNNGTPIASVSGVADMAVTDSLGNLSLYVGIAGTYHLDIYDTNATTFVRRYERLGFGDSGTQLRSDLDAPDGASLVGEAGGGTVQSALDAAATAIEAFADSSGSSGVGFLQAGAGAVARTVQDKMRERVSITDFGAVGDCDGSSGDGADNTAAIQAALDHLGAIGGGMLEIPPSTGGYRITSGLKQPSNVVIEGPWGKGYPYSVAGSLIADFSNANQWAIEPKTTVSGSPVAYNVMLTSLPSGATQNCGLRNLTLRVATGGVVPYGAVRFHGCPGSYSEGLSVVGFGHGLLVNFTTGGFYEVHAETLYSGVVNWDDANGNLFRTYVAQADPYPTTVPAGYLLPFMSSLSAILTTTYHLTTNAHYNRPQGIICGSLASSSNSVIFDAVIERFTGGIFLLNTFSIGFGQCYIEKHAGGMSSAIVAAQATFSIQDLYVNMSASGNLFDIGAGGAGDVRANGALSVSSFGSVYGLDLATRLLLRGVTLDQIAPATMQLNILYETPGQMIAPTLVNSWANVGGYVSAGYRREAGRVFLDGTVTGGAAASTITTLPVGYRPFAYVRGPGFQISPAGVITADTTGPLSFTGFNYVATG